MEKKDSTSIESNLAEAGSTVNETGYTSSEARSVEGGGEQGKPVAWSTHKQLLAQRKHDLEKLSQYEEQEKQASEARDLKKGEFNKVLTTYKDEIGALKGELKSFQDNETYQRKIYAVQKKLPGSVKKDEYYSFLDIDDVQLDPETGSVDDLSVERVVNKFVENYSDLIAPKESKKLPNHGGFNFSSVGKSLKDLSSAELKELYINNKFK